jgi:hypothetical protein
MFFVFLLCGVSAGDVGQMRKVEVDAGAVIGAIRSLQGVNGGPTGIRRGAVELGRQYRDLRIDLVRTHDFFGPEDIDARWPNPDPIATWVRADGSRSIFPRWEADPEIGTPLPPPGIELIVIHQQE